MINFKLNFNAKVSSALKACLRKNPTTDESGAYISDETTTPATAPTMDDGSSKKILSVSAFKKFPPTHSLSLSLYNALSIVHPAV